MTRHSVTLIGQPVAVVQQFGSVQQPPLAKTPYTGPMIRQDMGAIEIDSKAEVTN